ncbi:MAG: flagellar biosynthetic protein FliO [Acidobacteria bacterium]|nr:flagellar biosynthetic protein FliO [Acidobacteriota bacterium]
MMKSVRSALMVLSMIAAAGGVLCADAPATAADGIESENTVENDNRMPAPLPKTTGFESGQTGTAEGTGPVAPQGPVEFEPEEPAATKSGIPAASQQASVEPQQAPAAGIAGGSIQYPIFRAVGGLGLVLCLMAMLFFAARKFLPHYFKKDASEQHLKILETLPVGDRRSIALIQVADKRFLIGSTQQQINLLSTIDEPAPLASGAGQYSGHSKGGELKKSGDSFRNLFELEKKRPAPKSGNPLPEDIRAKMRLLREALER